MTLSVYCMFTFWFSWSVVYADCFQRAKQVEELDSVASKLFRTNVVGNIHLFDCFLPFVMKGKVKKVIAISSGHADLDFINDLDVETSALYSTSKAAMNVIVAKFNNTQYKKTVHSS